MEWHHLADVGDIADDAVIGRECGGHRIAIYHVAGRYHATGDLCTHGQALVSQGEVVEGFIECPRHHGLFEIATGRAQGAPVSRDLPVYPVRVVDGRIEVGIGPGTP